MATLCNSGIGIPLWRVQALVQAWACERLIMADCTSCDLRWSVITLLSQALKAAVNALAETTLRRAFQGARFAQRITAADTMLAAGGR
ncbi:MAG: hypothetical protein ACREDL_06555 [Bradyrhizobium sp.]